MKDKNYHVNIPGYQTYHFAREYKHDRAKRASGGFLILISNCIHDGVRVQWESDNLVWVVIRGSHLNQRSELHIGFVYIPPESSPHSSMDCFTNICESVANRFRRGEVIICGDTNARTGNLLDYVPMQVLNEPSYIHNIKPNEHPRNNVDKIINNYGRQLIDMCKYTGLQICNGRLTKSAFTCYKHNGESVVDYLLATPNVNKYVSKINIADKTADSDHCAITFDVVGNQNIQPQQKRTNKAPVAFHWDPHLKYIFCQRLGNSECEALYENFLCMMIENHADRNVVVNGFYDFITSAISPIFKLRKGTYQSVFPRNSWFDADCKVAKMKLRQSGKYVITAEERKIYTELHRDYRRLIQYKKRKHQLSVATKFEQLVSSDPQEYWRIWRKNKARHPHSEILRVDTFTDFFKSTDTMPNDNGFDIYFMKNIEKFIACYDGGTPIKMCSILDEILNVPICPDETSESLKRLKNNKAAGTDAIPSEFYKYSDGLLINPLTALFNYVFECGFYPEKWCEGLVNPLHKQGEIDKAENYRKITVTSALGKVFDSILNRRLRFAKRCLNIDDPYQYGFKENTGATDSIFILNGLIDKAKAYSRPLFVCFIDFKSAFDLVNRFALLYKLLNYGISGNFFAVIRSMFKNASSRVKWNGELGNIFENVNGVLQGGVMSPTLFNLFVEDLSSYLDNSKGVTIGDRKIDHLFFADDLVLLSETNTGLQSLINSLEIFCSQWHMVVNLTKTKVMVFQKKIYKGTWYAKIHSKWMPDRRNQIL